MKSAALAMCLIAASAFAQDRPTAREITPEQSNELSRSYGEFLGRAARALETLSKKGLSAEQTSQMERIRKFKKQAEDQFEHAHPVTAVELARRACLLAEDLVSRVR